MSNLEKDLAKIHERAQGLLWVIGEEDIKVERIIAPGETSRGKYDQRTHYEVHIRVRSDREEGYKGLGTIKLSKVGRGPPVIDRWHVRFAHPCRPFEHAQKYTA